VVLVAGGWLVMWLAQRCGLEIVRGCVKLLFLTLVIMMQLLQWVIAFIGRRETDALLLVLVMFAGLFLFAVVRLVLDYVRRYSWKPLLQSWGIYLVIAAILALPQLFIWTFGQATGEQFLRGYFNWANIDDNYIWFYIKNLGVALLLFVPAYLCGGRKLTAVGFPILIIWLIAELAVFQPNVYDNNKLLYVAYLLMCGVAADFMAELYRRMKNSFGKHLLAAAVLFLCTISGVLTIGRECVAEYQLVGPDQYKLGEYVMENTEPHDKFLTDTRHNNVIAALTGRNIQCGSGSYVYYHGLDYYEQEQAIRTMYEEPAMYPDIFDVYGIDYIVISPYEYYNYSVDEWTISAMYPCVYDADGVRVYQVKE
jgi:hypothetical protein